MQTNPYVLKFQSSTCNPCKQLTKIIANTQTQDISIVDVWIDEDMEALKMARKNAVTAVPTVILIQDDVEIKRHTGSMTAQQWQDFVGFVPQEDTEESAEST